jgi:hypothetical protein
MKTLLVLIAVISLGLAGLANAQCNTDPDEIGIFWTQACENCITCLDFFNGPTQAYVILINSTQPGGVGGFEFSLTNADGSLFAPPPADFVTTYTLPPGAINVASAPDFVVGLATPTPYSPCIILVTIDMLIFDPAPWCFGVKPFITPSIPGHMAYVPYDDPSFLLPMYPNTGPGVTDYTMACLNDPNCPPGPIATEETTWGTLKSLYR